MSKAIVLPLGTLLIFFLKEAIDSSLTDTYYTVLLALDGSTGIGGMQHTFQIFDEDKNLISECGELESEAYEQFHENNS